MEFKDVLRNLRKEKGVGQVELANAIGVSKGVISFWETGRNEPTYAQPFDFDGQAAQLSYRFERAVKGKLPLAHQADGRRRGRDQGFEAAVTVGVGQGHEQHCKSRGENHQE